MQSFLYYWPPHTVDFEVGRGEPLHHSASEQFDRVSVGDEVWHVTVRKGRLGGLGRIKVGHVTDQKGAARLMGTDDLWRASHHIVSRKGTHGPIRDTVIPKLAESLRFESKRDPLMVRGGKVSVQQLRTMRTLTPTCASELNAAFRRFSNGA